MQVLEGLRMNIIPPVSTINLTMDMVVEGLTIEQADAAFQDSVPAILNVVSQLEERLALSEPASVK